LIRQGKAKFIHKCARVRDAIKVASLGADAVSIVGFECGGHPGMDDVTTLILAPLTVDSVSIPVVAGGGFVDGRGLIAALALGADGIVMGTRFMATKESAAHPNVKEWMLKAGEADTVVIQRSIRSNSRVAKTPPAIKVAEMEARGATLEELMSVIGGGQGRQAMFEGKIEAGTMACGEAVSLIRDIPTVQEVVERIISEADAIRQKLAR
jgi:nitronate monooxygenase